MSTASNKQFVIDAWKVFATRDADQVRALFMPDAEWMAPAGNATSRAIDGTHHLVGRDRIVRFLTEEFSTVFVDNVFLEFSGFYADGDTVIVEVRLQATLGHGGHYDNEYCFIFELEAGLIKRVREYMDTQRGAAWFRSPSPADGKHHPGLSPSISSPAEAVDDMLGVSEKESASHAESVSGA
ncbi:SnoaL-like domain-containing protein [Nonomuraea sp. FMUSA5-5]|uniref:SnoaL-like domain-containing protein n=1 Tax=Nonomuraea composti TaxID=2720023 RepID=A0ABX1BRC4_9ACTN|nr:nuclear transport factor 2 family protein [Nonomuraea sp. FMUSA5-5]NJP97728.1 SnoaL-like domain-containing protein [Nonomuraea sp. FMUSA5-5]